MCISVHSDYWRLASDEDMVLKTIVVAWEKYTDLEIYFFSSYSGLHYICYISRERKKGNKEKSGKQNALFWYFGNNLYWCQYKLLIPEVLSGNEHKHCFTGYTYINFNIFNDVVLCKLTSSNTVPGNFLKGNLGSIIPGLDPSALHSNPTHSHWI